jgi:hypothetical protein
MVFTKEDFHTHAQRLNVIINDKMGLPILSNFRELSKVKKTKFNTMLNEYIKALPEEYEKKLLDDFNFLCQDKVFDGFKPEEHFIRELTMESKLLMTPEQEEWDKAGRPLEPIVGEWPPPKPDLVRSPVDQSEEVKTDQSPLSDSIVS